MLTWYASGALPPPPPQPLRTHSEKQATSIPAATVLRLISPPAHHGPTAASGEDATVGHGQARDPVRSPGWHQGARAPRLKESGLVLGGAADRPCGSCQAASVAR